MITFSLKEPDKFKIAIAFKGHSMRSFAKGIGISNAFLTLLINGNTKASAKMAKKIANGLDKEIEDIFFMVNG